jgi:hypothetical protein
VELGKDWLAVHLLARIDVKVAEEPGVPGAQ